MSYNANQFCCRHGSSRTARFELLSPPHEQLSLANTRGAEDLQEHRRLLDDKSISDENILAVTNRNGETLIGPVDAAGRFAIRDHLFTAGELLRLNQLAPDLEEVEKTSERQLELFGKTPA